MTASTVTNASENSAGAIHAKSDEAVKSRQREKLKAKRKAQKERRKAKAVEDEETEEDSTSATPTSTVDDDDEGLMRIEGTSGNHVILRDKDGNVLIRGMQGLQVINFKSLLKPESDDEKHSLGEEDSSSPSDGSEKTKDDSGVDVVQATTVEEMDRAVKNAKGPIFMVDPEVTEDAAEKKAYVEDQPGLQYVWSRAVTTGGMKRGFRFGRTSMTDAHASSFRRR